MEFYRLLVDNAQSQYIHKFRFDERTVWAKQLQTSGMDAKAIAAEVRTTLKPDTPDSEAALVRQNRAARLGIAATSTLAIISFCYGGAKPSAMEPTGVRAPIKFTLCLAALARAALAFATLILAGSGVSLAAEPSPCQSVNFEDNDYAVCEFDLRRHKIQLFWKAADGTPYGSLGGLTRSMNDKVGNGKPGNGKAGQLTFAMNAGMYHADLRPVGLYIENGQELVKANNANGPGNFHMKPNGVFYIAGDTAGVVDTAHFLKSRPKADFATQSGPMLVIDGKLHPRFRPTGQSKKVRNGVGLRDAHTVVFAISNGPVGFTDFARLFRDRMKCNNALFLDGSISSLYAPSVGRSDSFWPAGPIVGAFGGKK